MAQIGEISVEITADISDLQRDLQRASSELSNFGNRMESIGSRMGAAFDRMTDGIGRVSERMRDLGDRGREMGENMVDMSENLMQGITVPLAALAAGAVKASLDMSRLGSIVKANMEGVKGSIEEVRGVAEKVFRAGLGKDAEEVGRAVALIKRNFNDLNKTQLTDLAMQIHGVAEALGTDASSVLEDVIELTKKYKITTQQALDLVAAGYDETSLKGKNLSQVLKEVSGSAKEMSATMQKDPTVVWRGNLRSLLATLAPLGKELLKIANDYLPKVTNAIQKAVGWFTRQSDATKKMIVGFAAFAAVLPFITLTLGALAMAGSSVVSFFGRLGTTIKNAATAVSNFVKRFGALRTLSVGTGIAAAAALIYDAYKNSKKFADFVNKTLKGTLKSLEESFKSFGDEIKTIKDDVKELGAAFAGLFKTLRPLGILLGGTLVLSLGLIGGVLNGIIRMIPSLLSAVVNAISGVVNTINGLILLLLGDFSGFWSNMQAAGWNFVKAFINIFVSLFEFFGGIWNTLASIASQFGIDLNQIVANAFNSLVQKTTDFVYSMLQWFGTLFNGIGNAWSNFKAWLSNLWNSIFNSAVSIFNSIKTAISNAVSSTVSWLSQRWNQAKNTVTNAWNSIKSKATSVWNSIRSTIRNAVDQAVNTARSKFNSLKSTLSNIWSSIKSTVSNAMSSIANAIRNGFSRAVSAVQSAGSRIKSVLSSLAKSAYSWGANLASMFARGISAKISAAVAAAKNAAAKIKSYLGWSSPTKEGPGRDSDEWAPNLMNMLAAGIRAGIPKVQASVNSVASVISEVQPLDGVAPSGANNTINVYPQRANLNPAQLMRELQRASRLNGGGII